MASRTPSPGRRGPSPPRADPGAAAPLTAFLSWGALYAAFVLVLPYASVPGRQLPAYALFLLCLTPWSVWLVPLVRRIGGAAPTALAVQAAVVLAVTYPVQILGTVHGYWDYVQDRDSLLGFRLGGVPVEEYFFYPLSLNMAMLYYLLVGERLRSRGVHDEFLKPSHLKTLLLGGAACCFALAVYFFLKREPLAIASPRQWWDDFAIPHLVAGPRDYAWTLTCLLSLSGALVALWVAELNTPMRLRAILPASAMFFLTGLLLDLIGLSRGWWVYNAQHTSGWWLGPVPLENLAMYSCGVPETAALFEGIRQLLGDRRAV